MSDIVERLRSINHLSVEDCYLQSPLFTRAADEIERLREERDEARQLFNDINLCQNMQAPCEWALTMIRDIDEAKARLAEAVEVLRTVRAMYVESSDDDIVAWERAVALVNAFLAKMEPETD